MIAIIVHDQFVIHQPCHAARVLPVEVGTDIGLLHVGETVVDDYIRPALQSVFHELFQLWQFFFGHLCDDLAKVEAALAEVGVEVPRLVVAPAELFILHTILSELYSVDLCRGILEEQKGERQGADYPAHNSIVQNSLIDCRRMAKDIYGH